MKTEIKNAIVDLLSDKKAREAIDIIKSLGYNREYDSLIMETINEMVNEYDLYMTKHGRYMNFQDSDLANSMYKGIFQSTKGEYGFVIVSNLDEDIYIDSSNVNSAMDGDLVLVNVIKGKTNTSSCEGKIVKVLKRDTKTKVAEVVNENGIYFGILKDDKKETKMLLEGEGIERLVDGDLVAVSLNNEIKKHTPVANFKKRLGHKNDPGIDIVAVLAEHDFDVEFPDDVIEQLKTIPSEVSESELKGRTDLRDMEIFTIDGDDTKDIDDAISLKVLPNDNYELGVHIADVSYYVKENTPLDKEARKRGTSVYLADRVVPMLPHQLSNGICSLNPNVDRLSVSCVMEIDKNGKIVDYQIYPSVIRSRIQMTYNKVNDILERDIVDPKYEKFVPTLKKMQELANILRKRKINQGYIDFDVDEAKIVVDSEGKVLDIVKRYRGVGEKLIEDFMIAANECVASYIDNMDLPGIYRVHGEVNVDRLRKFINQLGLLGIKINENLNGNVNQKMIQRILKEFSDNEAFQILATLMLSCMDKAKYQTNNIGHFALALRNYTHFTSPIRRYPDTMTHRLLRNYFFLEDGITDEKIRHFESILDDICLTASERERASIDCEREVDKMKMAEYMESHIGEVYEGIVSGITSFGMFVMLPDKLIEGMVRLDTSNLRLIYDATTETIIESKTHQVYSIGTKLKIKVINASKDLRQIDFEIEKGDEYENSEKTKTKKKYS